ncbi:NAD(P)-binding protein [Aspergillus eucalypticola CBS 122712]|uniref:NAD(P)-binding protein n=1 Tax=Aspergillus eucalypticola (strain CBS 122712 / IBT 29274) TaxID=1448314 RepID=A0A317VBH4_ASPEC|nr:NAD(P)-binding protein [Aspergillus eucalypticola CBS 122712]PWY70601.1 NAD(P)-binding protein [Aspergillus eucalypticola CBS 122712]
MPANFANKIPDTWSFEESAGLMIFYATVIWCFDVVGELRKGQTVLVHSAFGGVGLAAIQFCEMRGAQVYATVGSEEKVRYLVNGCHIPRSRIFYSRDTSFYRDLMRETNNRGVDIVLSSLPGKLLHAPWKCVAPGGKMFDIGKRDVLGHSILPMNPFDQARSSYTRPTSSHAKQP